MAESSDLTIRHSFSLFVSGNCINRLDASNFILNVLLGYCYCKNFISWCLSKSEVTKFERCRMEVSQLDSISLKLSLVQLSMDLALH